MLDDFMIRAGLAGIGMVLAAAPLGCFVVWRRMAYFGDATAHAAMLGVALGLALEVPVLFGVLAVALTVGVVVSRLSDRGFASDTVLGVMAHSALAAGLVAVSFMPNVRVDLMSYLFGDILTVDLYDVSTIWTGAALVIGILWWRWARLLLATLGPELARADGINPSREQLAITLCLALVVAVAIKVVGVLLISAMLIIPAAAARSVARSPEVMVVIAVIFGMISVISGLAASYYVDTPAGPTMVCAASVLFLLSLVLRRQA